MFIADALAMPVHWYYNRDLLRRDYGHVTDYLAPRNPHPESVLARSEWTPPKPEVDILGDQAPYWGKPGIHYHQKLLAGENTLNLKLARELTDFVSRRGAFDSEGWAERYIAFMTRPDEHNDTYVEEAHRNFFTNYGKGRPLHDCAEENICIGGLCTVIPLLLLHHRDLKAGREVTMECLKLTHGGGALPRALSVYATALHHVLHGVSLEDALFTLQDRHEHAALAFPYRRWRQKLSDEQVATRELATVCYVDDAFPLTLYLALKYELDFEKALTVNTNLGGDNVHRGALIGAMVGARVGCEGIPGEFVEGLTDMGRLDELVDALWDAAQAQPQGGHD